MPIPTQRLPPRVRRAAEGVNVHVLQSYPYFFLRTLPRALRPRTFPDFVRRKMLFDRRPYLAITTDKAQVRDYVRDHVGEHVLPKAYAITEDPRTIDWGALPRTYVCKPTHGSGGVVVVTDDADPDARLPTAHDKVWTRSFVRPEHANPDQLTEVCLRWVRHRFGWGPGSTHQHQYRHITPRILIEELLRRPDGALAYEYQFYVFHGRCELIIVVSDRMTDIRIDLFRPDWTRVHVDGKSRRADVEPQPPAELGEMVRIAEKLGAETDFVRVDLYDLGGRIVFGELTNTPNAGQNSADPAFDLWRGTFWGRGR